MKNFIFKLLTFLISVLLFLGSEYISYRHLNKNYYSADIHLDSFSVWEFENNYGPRLRRNPFLKKTNTFISQNEQSNISSSVIGKMNFDQSEGYIRMGEGDFLINKWGIKGPYFKKERGENIYRILVFGGSTTQGNFENELDYPRVLERMLNNKLNSKTHYQIINMGQSAKTSCHIKKKIMEYAPEFKPDMIIVTTGLNDFSVSKNYNFKGVKDYCDRQLTKVSILNISHTYRLLKYKLLPMFPKIYISEKEKAKNILNNSGYYGLIIESIILEAKKRGIKVGLMLSPITVDVLTSVNDIEKMPQWEKKSFQNSQKTSAKFDIALYQKYLNRFEKIQKRLGKKYLNSFYIHNNLSIHTKGKKYFFGDEVHPSGPGNRIIALSIYNALNQKYKFHTNPLLNNIDKPINKNELEILFLKSFFIANQIEDLSLSYCVAIHGTCTQIKHSFPDIFYATHAVSLSLGAMLQFPNEIRDENIKEKLEGYLLKAEKKVKDFSLIYWTLYLINQSYGDIEKAQNYKKQAYQLNPLLEEFSFEKNLEYFERINISNPFIQRFKFFLNFGKRINADHLKIPLSHFRYLIFKLINNLISNPNSRIEDINQMFYDLYLSSPLLAQSLLKSWIKALDIRGLKLISEDIKIKAAKLKPEYEFNQIFKP